ncbi:MAG: PKD domain-containing protein, partial [Bacteroidota bacterium]
MTGEANFACPTDVMSCDGTRAMVQNFMEYTNDACMNLFTVDQRNRMRTVLENSPRRKELLTSNACQTIVAPPTPSFVANVQTGCAPLEVQFTSTSQGKPTKYQWFFQGGRPASSSKQNPVVSFRKPGSYPVSLQVSNAGGTQSEVKEGFIHVRKAGITLPYVADFEWERDSESAIEQIVNPQEDQSWRITQEVSRGGKGAITINQYDNQLKGAIDWFLTPVLDLSQETKPILSFEVAYAAFNESHTDTLAVFIATGCETIFRNIYFKGGQQLATTSLVARPFSPEPSEWRTEYLDLSAYAGQSNVQLAFVSQNGYGNDVYLDDIRVGKMLAPKPISAFEAQQVSVCAGNSVEFKDQSQFSPTKWVWSFPGGNPASSTEQNPTVNYREAGTYPVTLTTFTEGGSHTLKREAYVSILPQPDIQIQAPTDPVCMGEAVTLSVSGLEQPIWSTANGANQASGTTINITPREDATYRINGESENGCSATREITIRVKKPQRPLQITPKAISICEGESIDLRASGGSNYRWGPTSGLNRANGPMVTASPTQTTTYYVKATVDNGCDLQVPVTVEVDPAPKQVNIAADKQVLCPGETATLTARGAASFTWLGGGGLNTRQGAQVLASPTGTTTYSIRAASQAGCVANLTYTLTVAAAPQIALKANLDEVCAGSPVQLTASGGKTYRWTTEGNITPSASATIQVNPAQNTRFLVEGLNAAGCTDTASLLVRVQEVMPPEIQVSSASICRGGSSMLQVIAAPGSRYRWRPSGGLSATDLARVVASPRRNTTYTVQVTQPNGCKATATTTININRGQRPEAAFSVEKTVACAGESIQFQGEAKGAAEYFWEFPTGFPTTSRELNPKVQFFNPGSHDVFLRVTGCDGQTDDVARYRVIEVNQGFEVSLNQSDLTICRGESLELMAEGGDSYQWSPAIGLSATSGAKVVASPSVTTTYTVEATNSGGCVAKQR